MKKCLVVAVLLMAQMNLVGCGAGYTRSNISFYEEPFLDKDDVIIYVYRLPSILGARVPWSVKLDGQQVAVIRQNAYIVLHTTTGIHQIVIGDTNILIPAEVAVDVALGPPDSFATTANGVYYIRSQGASVDFLSKDEAMKELVNMKYDP